MSSFWGSFQTFVKVIGTSYCDMVVSSKEKVGDSAVEGICGQVDGFIIPDLVALDWLNGRRTPFADQKLKGAIIGLTLGTTPLKIFRALVEATAWAQARRPIPCLGTTHADYFYGEVPCTDIISDKCIARDYERETGSLIVNAFKDIDYHNMRAVLVVYHGPFSGEWMP